MLYSFISVWGSYDKNICQKPKLLLLHVNVKKLLRDIFRHSSSRHQQPKIPEKKSHLNDFILQVTFFYEALDKSLIRNR